MKNPIKHDIDDLTQLLSEASLEIDNILTIIGILNGLSTVNKTDLVGAINEVFQSGSSWKTDIATAITNKGIATSGTDTKETFISNIESISSGGTTLRPMILEITTTTANKQFGFPAFAPYSLNIDWGDGSPNTVSTENGDSKIEIIHTYSVAGTYIVTINGQCRNFRYNAASGYDVLKKIIQIDDVSFSLDEAFRGCYGLTDINGAIIDSPYIYNADSMFYMCTNITTIPPNMIANSNLTAINYMFSGCNKLTSIPSGFFTGTNISVANYVFRDCTALTLIPADIFQSSNLYNVNYMFSGCWKITDIPESIFQNTPIVYANYFMNNGGLTSIPAGLFTNTLVTSISYAFAGNIDINTTIPEYWNIPNKTWSSTSKCFNGCTNALNYASIPTTWK